MQSGRMDNSQVHVTVVMLDMLVSTSPMLKRLMSKKFK